tara:strand:- start:1299 stop:1448 length:150 start_codon:yes stop_codon:yes gene_type:complete
LKDLGEIEVELILEALLLKRSITISQEGKAALDELVIKLREIHRKGVHV